MMWGLALIFGAIIGLSLGLTGGGGAIFAVPLLVYGLGMPAKDAVVTSLSAVGIVSMVGFLSHWRRGQVELRTGLLFAIAGMLGAPLGTWIANRLSESVLMLSFAGLMVIAAIRLWQQANQLQPQPVLNKTGDDCLDGPTCQRDVTGELLLNSRCAVLLLLVGLVTGVLSGLFGVGGGFIIVPALVLFSGMPIHRAVGTSLMVIVLISVAGVISQISAGRTVPLEVTPWFVLGGVVGLFIGSRIGQRLSGPVLQKVFVVAILAVALFVIMRNLIT
ncbi:sulfite exporter TauE/SafE family protein [Planctomicrobium sp. SH527]|uniref:sulfite exporter TauE/SafE family protein n=1 Tax=Planctomicrobium sp. SH527 TaxID=3448123 RepID=UPI003F5C64D8